MWVCYVWVESLKLYFTESATKDESSVWTKDIVDWEHYVGFLKIDPNPLANGRENNSACVSFN